MNNGDHLTNSFGKDFISPIQLETYLPSILNNLPHLVWLKDTQGRFLMVNQAWLESMGVESADQVIGHTDYDFFTAELADQYQNGDREVMEKAQQKLIEEQVPVKGTLKWFETYKSPLRDASGAMIGTTGFARDITERKQAEAALKAGEEKFRTIIEQSEEGFGLVDEQGSMIEWNPAIERMTGIPREKALGNSFWSLIELLMAKDQVDRLRNDQLIEQAQGMLANGLGSLEGEKLIQTRSGQMKNIHYTIFAIVSEQGSRLCITLHDITEKQQAEVERKEQLGWMEQLNQITHLALEAPDLDHLLDTLSDHLASLARCDGCYITLWDETNEITQIKAASDSLRPSLAFMPKEIKDLTLTASVLRSGKPLLIADVYDSPHISPDVAPLFPRRSALGLPLCSGEQDLGAIILVMDSPEKIQETELEYLEQAAALGALMIGRTLLVEETRQRAGELETLSRFSTALRGAHSRSQVLGVVLEQIMQMEHTAAVAIGLVEQDSGDVVVEAGRGSWESSAGERLQPAQGIYGQVIASGEPVTFGAPPENSAALERQSGRSLRSIACLPLIAQKHSLGVLWVGAKEIISGKKVNLLSAMADVAANAIHRQMLDQDLQNQLAAMQKTKDRLVQSEKLAAVGELVAGVAHELNNPLASILLYTDLIQRHPRDDESVRRDFEKINSETRRAAGIVRGLLDFARQRSPERKLVQVNDVIRSSLDLLAYELRLHNVQVEQALDPRLPPTMGDPHQLQQVFVNLATNAWQAMGANTARGRLKVSTGVGPPTYMASQSGLPEVIRISFQDNGPGIPPDKLLRIFDPFFTTKPEGEGTGLGLSVCHGIIAEHRGHIWAESVQGNGALFIIELPILRPATSELIALGWELPERATVSTGSARILVVEDEGNILEGITRALRNQGFKVDPANSGPAALALVKQQRYDLILCDMRMPEMSGPDFYRATLAIDMRQAKRMLFTSGDIISPTTQRFIEETGAPFLAKPLQIKDLVGRIQSLLVLWKESGLGRL